MSYCCHEPSVLIKAHDKNIECIIILCLIVILPLTETVNIWDSFTLELSCYTHYTGRSTVSNTLSTLIVTVSNSLIAYINAVFPIVH